MNSTKKSAAKPRFWLKGEVRKVLYKVSYSFGFIRYSKKEGIGYLSPFGADDEGSETLLSIIGCLPIEGIVGFPDFIGYDEVICEPFISNCCIAIFKHFQHETLKKTCHIFKR